MSSDYSSLMEELVARTPHEGDDFTEDNTKVFQILQEVIGGSSHEVSIKEFWRTRNGRGAYLALFQHNLGLSKWDRMIEACETYLLCHEWNGRNRQFTLKMHINKHRDVHNELVRAAQYVTYELPNGHILVSRLLKSITCKDPTILSAITHIRGTTAVRGNFESAASILLLTAPSPKDVKTSF